MKIMIGSDHGGFQLKEEILCHLEKRGHDVINAGIHSLEPVDYPTIALEVAHAVAQGRVERAVLICGSGIGMCMAANRVCGIRAALAYEPYGAKMSRRHNDSNVLCLGGRFTGPDLAREIVDTWLEEPFEGGRHERRVRLMDELACK